MAERTITLRGIRDTVLRSLRASAAENKRSLNAEVLIILERAVSGGEESAGPRVTSRSASRLTHAAGYRAEPPLLKSLDRGAIASFCRKNNIAWLALFGSHARGDARQDSDVDLVAEFEPGRTPGFAIVQVAEGLSRLLQGKRVDLVTIKGLSPAMRERVLASSEELHGAR